MEKLVTVQIRSIQSNEDGQQEAFHVFSEGCYYEKGSEKYVLFEEKSKDTCEIIKSRLQVTPKNVRLKKSGAVDWEIVLEQGRRMESCYRTPFGVLPMTIFTEKLSQNETENQIRIEVAYKLESSGALLSTCEMTIIVESRKMSDTSS